MPNTACAVAKLGTRHQARRQGQGAGRRAGVSASLAEAPTQRGRQAPSQEVIFSAPSSTGVLRQAQMSRLVTRAILRASSGQSRPFPGASMTISLRTPCPMSHWLWESDKNHGPFPQKNAQIWNSAYQESDWPQPRHSPQARPGLLTDAHLVLSHSLPCHPPPASPLAHSLPDDLQATLFCSLLLQF